VGSQQNSDVIDDVIIDVISAGVALGQSLLSGPDLSGDWLA